MRERGGRARRVRRVRVRAARACSPLSSSDGGARCSRTAGTPRKKRPRAARRCWPSDTPLQAW
eukprot:5142530-Prymnesium_polylepis.1